MTLGIVKKLLDHSSLLFCTLTSLKSLAVAMAMSVFFALLLHKITSLALVNLFRSNTLILNYHPIPLILAQITPK